jgi:antitoxin CcdA
MPTARDADDAMEKLTMRNARQAKKRAVDLFVDVELLEEARRLNINISETLEQRLRSLVRAEQEKRWLEENRDAIASINAFIDRHGLLADRLRLRPAHGRLQS